MKRKMKITVDLSEFKHKFEIATAIVNGIHNYGHVYSSVHGVCRPFEAENGIPTITNDLKNDKVTIELFVEEFETPLPYDEDPTDI